MSSVEEQFLLQFNKNEPSDNSIKQWLKVYSRHSDFLSNNKKVKSKSKLTSMNSIGSNKNLPNNSIPKSILNKEKLEKSLITFSSKAIENIENINFDIFKCEAEVGPTLTLPVISTYTFLQFGLFEFIDHRAFDQFIKSITAGYNRTNGYHTDLHAADVLHACYVMLNDGDIINIAKLDRIDMTALLLSAITHDFKHPGLTNGYLINTRDPIAISYNGDAVSRSVSIGKLPRGGSIQNNQ